VFSFSFTFAFAFAFARLISRIRLAVSTSEPPNFCCCVINTSRGCTHRPETPPASPAAKKRAPGESVFAFVWFVVVPKRGGVVGVWVFSLEEPLEPTRGSELHDGHRDAHQDARGPPAVPHRGV
jgi:hypothetical protein